MATRTNAKKLAGINWNSQEQHLRNNLSREKDAPQFIEDYVTQVTEKTEGRVTIQLSQYFSRVESQILVARSKSDEFVPKSQFWCNLELSPESPETPTEKPQSKTWTVPRKVCILKWMLQ